MTSLTPDVTLVIYDCLQYYIEYCTRKQIIGVEWQLAEGWKLERTRLKNIKNVPFILYFKLSPCSECCMLSSG